MQRPKLKDKRTKQPNEPYSLGDIPDALICEIGKWIVYAFATGKDDINGEDWGDIFSKAVNGEHLNKPLGLADVILRDMAWSVKSVKNDHPHQCTRVRVISGRCSPDYSYGITDPHADIAATGTAVLGIWNERINIAKDNFEPLRSALLVRNPASLEFCLYEHELSRYNTADYLWQKNKNGNLIAKDKTTNEHIFTWQPHGGQFTINYTIPKSAKCFAIKRPPVLNFESVMREIGFDKSWVTIMPSL